MIVICKSDPNFFYLVKEFKWQILELEPPGVRWGSAILMRRIDNCNYLVLTFILLWHPPLFVIVTAFRHGANRRRRRRERPRCGLKGGKGGGGGGGGGGVTHLTADVLCPGFGRGDASQAEIFIPDTRQSGKLQIALCASASKVTSVVKEEYGI